MADDPRYERGEEIARGGMGRVVTAKDRVLGRTVALKETLLHDDDALERFRREIVVTARLEHPSIVPLYDAGTHDDGTPFYVMRKIGGRPLDALVSEARGLDARLTLLPHLLAAAQAIAHAHQQGVVHRDIKPTNILVGARGETFVIDWGLAKILGEHESVRESFDEVDHSQTRRGFVLGTVGFVAPEHRHTDEVTPSSDVFALGATMFFTLAGRLPHDVKKDPSSEFLPAPSIRSIVQGIPRELASIVDRALAFDPRHRYRDGAALADDLQRFLSGQLIASHHYSRFERGVRFVKRNRVALLVTAIALAASTAGIVFATQRARAAAAADRDRRVADHTSAAAELQLRLNVERGALERARSDAFASFDAKELERGEQLWTLARQRAMSVDEMQARVAEHLEHALVIDASRTSLRRQLAAVLLARAELADRIGANERRDELIRRLALHDVDGSLTASWYRKATVSLEVEPATAAVTIAPIVKRDGARLEGRAKLLARTAELAPGAYVIVATAPGRTPTRLPVMLGRGERLRLRLELPAADRVPDGFVYIPPGRFLVGSTDEQVRRSFLDTVPLHESKTDGYLIAQHETTFADWIAFLDTLPVEERERRRPRAAGPTGSVDLDKHNGQWRLRMRLTTHTYDVAQGSDLVYLDRESRESQNWLRMPVLAIAFDDAIAYAAWLRTSGRVPGARLCTEHEWERAARGADDREFPNGDLLVATEANFDETYQRRSRGMGPDEVGSWQASRSPFGLDDMAGNVAEWTSNSMSNRTVPVPRGGAWFWGSLTARVTNRWESEPTNANVMVGLRLCADS